MSVWWLSVECLMTAWWLPDDCLGRGICGSFFLSLLFSRSQVVNFFKWKHHFLNENITIFHSNGDFFTQYLFLNKKRCHLMAYDNLRARKQEREEKVTTNFSPIDCLMTVWWLSYGCLMTIPMIVWWLFNDYPMAVLWLTKTTFWMSLLLLSIDSLKTAKRHTGTG